MVAINAGTISLTAGSIFNSDSDGTYDSSVTLNARSGNLTLEIESLELDESNANTFTLSAEKGVIEFTRTAGTRFNKIWTLVLGGTITAAGDLEILGGAVSSINFAGVTTITGQGNITLTSPTVQSTASDADLTITAEGVDKNVTLEGRFNIGSGEMSVSASGDVLFTSSPTLTAASFVLSWNGDG